LPDHLYYAQNAIVIIKAIESFLDLKLADPTDAPTIAFSFSGGGYRAFTAAVGSMEAAVQSGLEGCVTYCGGVSGGGWFTSEFTNAQGDWSGFQSRIREAFTSLPFVHSPSTVARLRNEVEFTRAFRPNNNSSFIDLYGCMLMEQWRAALPEGERIGLRLSQQSFVKDGSAPLPIYNVVRPLPLMLRENIYEEKFEWWELTPFEMTSLAAEAAIPTWAFGRQFARGASVAFAPEYPACCVLGIVGSAFCSSVEEMDRVMSTQVAQNAATNFK